MTYYPAWFEYAKWLFAGGGGVCFFSMLSEPVGRRRGLLKLSGCVLIAAGATFGAVGGILFNLRAPHLTAEGVLFNVHVVHGKNSFSKFRLRTPAGELDGLSLSAACDELLDNEAAEVSYQDGSHRVLHLQILDGPYAGFGHSEGDELGSSWTALALALGLASYGILNWLNDGTAISPEVDSRAMPDGDVDTSSILDLSQK